jgi:hypothetical protein
VSLEEAGVYVGGIRGGEDSREKREVKRGSITHEKREVGK